ncbi:MAG: UDP-N-acetylglucosamine 4,6-dehydratase (inverting) [Alphaproteobacteria bacterium]|nr:UDP-N-acetylglucosamine 4,6-dehydratase (inverting) [Candidatus Parcubacteria bacterium]NCQ67538.1 UDP-N-acetylglucosamine 4,6-dehydratase (inverting) [Alphaproteobacteria bacterium]
MKLENKRILITGGTGSFGNAFIQLLLSKYNPQELIVYSRDELKQFEQANRIKDRRVRYIIGDIRDQDRLTRSCSGVDIIVHAAAIKQVVAAEHNPTECIKTNIDGAVNVINAAIDSRVKNVVALSTDKAVNPINLYGATKLCSDKLFSAANMRVDRGETIFSVVRYGNVIGSRGSVIPFFKEQAKTGIIPITDERMTRFWITLERGAEFVAVCAQRMKGGEVFISKIPSMLITDLAMAIAPECKIKNVGIRPGEKLHEMMIPKDESRRSLEFKDFYVICPDFEGTFSDSFLIYDGEAGKPVPFEFEYVSNTNSQWVTAEELRKMCL